MTRINVAAIESMNMDVTALLRAMHFSLAKQTEAHQHVRRMKEQLVSAATQVRLIKHLHQYDLGLIEELTQDLKESRLNEALARSKCQAVEREIEELRGEMEQMRDQVLRLQRELDLARNKSKPSVELLADREVDAIIRKNSSPKSRGYTTQSFENWSLGQFVEGYAMADSRPATVEVEDEDLVISPEAELLFATARRPRTSPGKQLPSRNVDVSLASESSMQYRPQTSMSMSSTTSAGQMVVVKSRGGSRASSRGGNASLPYLGRSRR